MLSQAISKPVVLGGDGYGWLYSAYLYMAAGFMRAIYWSVAGSSKSFDQVLYVDTPGLGDGKVRIAINTPRPVGHADSMSAQGDGLLPLVVILESGGFVIGQPENGIEAARRVSDQTGSVVISIDYAKAPRYPYPNALLQVYQVLLWAFSKAAHEQGVHVDPSRVCFLGFSAGGTLSAAIALLLSFSEGPCAAFRASLPPNFALRSQILAFPNLGCNTLYRERFNRSSATAQAKSLPIFALELMEDSYLPPYICRDQIFVAPLSADEQLLKELHPAPTLVLLGELDALAEEGQAYAEKLQRAQTQVRCLSYPNSVHGFTHIKHTLDINIREAEECWKEIIDQLSQVFNIE